MNLHKVLKDLFSKHLYYERDVMYALVNTRKYLELTETKEQYPELTFFCDWALHSRMSFSKAQAIVALVDNYENSRASHTKISEPSVPQELHDFLQFKAFRNELDSFLKTNEFAAYVTEVFWPQFLGTYAIIIAGSPLKCVNTKKSLKYVNEVNLTITKVNSPFEASQDNGVALEVKWQWTSLLTGIKSALVYSYGDSDLF